MEKLHLLNFEIGSVRIVLIELKYIVICNTCELICFASKECLLKMSSINKLNSKADPAVRLQAVNVKLETSSPVPDPPAQ